MSKAKLIPPLWDVPREFHERLGDRPGRQRVMLSDGHLFFVLHAPPQPDETTRTARLFWRKPDGSWQSTQTGNGLAAFEAHIEDFGKQVDSCDVMEHAAATAKEYYKVLERISPLKRASANLHHVLEEARRLLPEDRNIINLRDQAYDVSRTAELLYDATRNGMELAQTRRAEEQAAASMAMASSAHRLNLLAAFFFPLATLTAVFGMELNSGWETKYTPWPFLFVVFAGLMAGAILGAFVAQRPKK
ncbi:MAG: CorA family divalent cation transporter [Pirellulaceae bacterium]|nr:hypothetical protein [Planctomycetales bacterium]